MSPQAEPLKLALMSMAVLGLIYALMILFQSDDRPWVDGAKMWLPFIVATVPPYLIIFWRLAGRSGDAFGLGLAVVCGVLSILLLARYLFGMASVKEMAPLNLIVGLLFWHVTMLTAVVVFVPLQVKLVTSAFAVLSSSGRAASGIGSGVIFAVAYLVVGSGLFRGLGDNTVGVGRSSSYTETAPTTHLFKLYKCLWREAGPGAVNGFPESEEALRSRGAPCWDPTIAPGGSAYGTHYEFRYSPGPRDPDGVIRSFALATKKRSAPGRWTDSFYLDHLGVLRRSVEGWATAETDRIESFKRSIVPRVMGWLDAYHDVRGAYPVRILHHSQKDQAQPHDMVVPDGEMLARATEPGPDGTTIIPMYEGRISYAPQRAAPGGGAAAYTISIRSTAEGLRDLRSYFVDAQGRIHGTGEEREATAADPIAPGGEWAGEARAQTRQRVAARFAPAKSAEM